MAQACRLLEQDAPLTLEALASQLAMSPFHSTVWPKSVTGMTPKAWQQAWRAQPAGKRWSGDTGDPLRWRLVFPTAAAIIARPTQR
ncbi:hypothetical protein MJ579_20200 [Klebsiella pneumoniae]|nr:hypothetical protein MJ579_20200 [Klebsiella pneumoniae]